MRYLTAEQNAREEGRDCAVEWSSSQGNNPGTCQEWRETRRSKLIHQYENGEFCPLGSSDLPPEQFMHLIGEWDQGFDRAINVIIGAPEVRAAEIKRIAVQASAMCSLLGVTNIIPEERRLSTLRTCASIADEIASDLSVLTGDGQ
jgi:hypothetical protein